MPENNLGRETKCVWHRFGRSNMRGFVEQSLTLLGFLVGHRGFRLAVSMTMVIETLFSWRYLVNMV
jgi:hypothetical protein